MSQSRSTFYDRPPTPVAPDELVARIGAACDEFGYRRVGAALRQQGIVVNGKKLRRLMREQDLQPKRRRRYVITTDSDHAGPIFPDLAKGVVVDRPNQLWVADLTHVTISGRLRLPGCDSRCLIAQGRRLCDQSVHGRPHCRRGTEGGYQEPCPGQGMYPPLRSWVAVCI